MSLALARKYRPLTFDDLIGQETISQTLSLALQSDRLSHAYLFSGLRGSGKTSTARIFAKALLCEKGVTSSPCGVCPHCVMAVENRHLDIIEMDAASNRGIDDIKELIEHTKYKPSSARYKIFIIDEVHMLTNQAFNALLKTLEEPPAFVKFILATTDPLKLPATILSRTQHFRFRRIPQHLILKHLEHILTLENVDYEVEALDIIARSGAGSLRDSLTLADQAIVYSKNFVDVATVTGMLGIIEPAHLEALLISILNKDEQSVLTFIKKASHYEAEMILDELTLYLKEKLLSLDTIFSPTIIEQFFKVIAESKSLLALGSDSEFVLALSFFKMMRNLPSNDIIPNNIIPEQKTTPIVNNIKENVTPQQETKQVIKENLEKIPQEVEIKEEKKIPSSEEIFKKLIKKIYDRNYDLGKLFEENILFESFIDNKLTWRSQVEGDEKKMLINHWGIINLFVKEFFGLETKIINIPKKKVINPQIKPLIEKIPTQDESQMKSSCIAPEAGETESAKEKNPSDILEEPMIKEAIALFNPKTVRIKRNS